MLVPRLGRDLWPLLRNKEDATHRLGQALRHRAMPRDALLAESVDAVKPCGQSIHQAAGNLLARGGCLPCRIGAKTSEVYTKGVERWTLAADAMRTLEDMEW